ncbi:MAG TPA: DMT family transporter [Xanthobacteraceae bacterium]|nr:DMT family transporter [Xanthobacteraceae bacterium]
MSIHLNALAIPFQAAKAASSQAEARNLYLGIGAGLLVVVCWAAWIIATRFAVTTHLRPVDVAFLRYAVPTALLAPVLWRHGLGFRQIGLKRTLLLVCGAGLPFLLVASTAMKFAPASDAGTVMVATMPVFVAVFSALLGSERFDRVRVIGFAAVAAGVAAIAAHTLLGGASGAWRGHLLFVAAAALFAMYTVTLRRSGVSPWHAAAIVNFYSFVALTPVYFLVFGSRLLSAPAHEVITQAAMQGVVTGVIALFLYGEAVRRLGAPRAAVLGSLTPVVVALLGMPLLGEFPTRVAWLAIVAVSLGVVLASGAFSRAPVAARGSAR